MPNTERASPYQFAPGRHADFGHYDRTSSARGAKLASPPKQKASIDGAGECVTGAGRASDGHATSWFRRYHAEAFVGDALSAFRTEVTEFSPRPRRESGFLRVLCESVAVAFVRNAWQLLPCRQRSKERETFPCFPDRQKTVSSSQDTPPMDDVGKCVTGLFVVARASLPAQEASPGMVMPGVSTFRSGK
jgi:hypothetical protein